MTDSMLTHAGRYITDRGWLPIPIPHKEKGPRIKEWQSLRLTVEDLPVYFGNGRTNIGIHLGASELGDVDLDCPEALTLADFLLPTTGCVFGRVSAPRSHRLYTSVRGAFEYATFDDPVRAHTDKKNARLIELRAGNHQTLFPPSVHPSGELVEWASSGEPNTLFPDELNTACKRLAAACLIARYWPAEGMRQEAALALAGGLERAQWSADEVAQFIRALAQAAGDEEAAKRVTAADYTARRLAENGTATGWPKLAQLIGDVVVDQVRTWLGIGHTTTTTCEKSEISEISKPQWPVAPGVAAFAGLAGQVVDTIDPHTEADRVALLGNFLTAFGCAVGRKPHVLVGATVHCTNLFMALVGQTSKARKGESWSPIRNLFSLAAPDWAANRMNSGLSSGEGLIWAVRDPIEKLEKVRGTNQYEKVVADEGVSDKRLLVIEQELASTLQQMGRTGNILSATIRNAWDQDRLESMTKNSPAKATGAHIAIIGHITVDDLRRELSATDAANGFANRFIWLAVKRCKLLPRPQPFAGDKVASMAGLIARSLEFTSNMARLDLSPHAGELWDAVYPSLSAERPGLVGAIVARAEAQVLRLAMLYALLDHSQVIDLPHMQSALEFWAYSERSAVYIFGDATGDPVADAIYNALRTNGRLTRTQVSELFGRHQSSNRISQALMLLLHLGRVITYQESGVGRSIEYWEIRPTPVDAENQ